MSKVGKRDASDLAILLRLEYDYSAVRSTA